MARHGPDKEICGAQRANQPPGVLCQNVAGERTNHLGIGRCYRHGGATESHNQAAQLELARRECDRLGIEIEIDPAEALIRAVWRAQGNLRYYEAEVADLGTPITQDAVPGGGYKLAAHPLVLLYHEAEKWAANVAASALRAGVEERRVRMAERDSAQIIQAQVAALTSLGLADRLDEFRTAFIAALDSSADSAYATRTPIASLAGDSTT